MSGGRIQVDHAGMAVLRSQLSDVAVEIEALPSPVREKAEAATEAAGEFSGDLAEGAAVFALSWTSALRAYGQCCTLLAAHVGTSSLELADLDRRAAAGLRETE